MYCHRVMVGYLQHRPVPARQASTTGLGSVAAAERAAMATQEGETLSVSLRIEEGRQPAWMPVHVSPQLSTWAAFFILVAVERKSRQARSNGAHRWQTMCVVGAYDIRGNRAGRSRGLYYSRSGSATGISNGQLDLVARSARRNQLVAAGVNIGRYPDFAFCCRKLHAG